MADDDDFRLGSFSSNDLHMSNAGNFVIHTQETGGPNITDFMNKYGAQGQYSQGGWIDEGMGGGSRALETLDKLKGEQLEMELANFQESGPGGYERAYINHQGGGFKFSGSRPNQARLNGCIIGMVKQRKLWKDQASGSKGTYCSSPDAQIGIPKQDFPWAKSNAKPNSESIECDTCAFTKWDSKPRCQEKWYVPIWLKEDAVDDPSIPLENVKVVIVEFTQSGIKPLREYFKNLVADSLLPFQARTEITTLMNVHNDREFWVPQLTYYEADESITANTEWTIDATRVFRKVRQDLMDEANRTFIPNPNKFSPIGLGPMGGTVP